MKGTEDLSSDGVALAGIAFDSYRNAYFFLQLRLNGSTTSEIIDSKCIYDKEGTGQLSTGGQ